ncbi:hypothetical protein Fmac_014287 [Flemingia macrophylla]|uniref:Uncharacterized protein n=1 Tax=Flemingia macrophylla TaxID=520843 RepID=A0ABD1MBC0_9FABA
MMIPSKFPADGRNGIDWYEKSALNSEGNSTHKSNSIGRFLEAKILLRTSSYKQSPLETNDVSCKGA